MGRVCSTRRKENEYNEVFGGKVRKKETNRKTQNYVVR
jgi:hypothetical protein